MQPPRAMEYKQRTGFTLVELVVASALFAVIVALAVNLFVAALRTPIQEIERHHLYEQVTYVFEQSTYYIHRSSIDYSHYGASTTNPVTELYLTANDGSDENYRIYLDSGQMKVDITVGNNSTITYPLTTSPTTDVYIQAAKFYVYPTVDSFDPANNNNNQPAVVVYVQGYSVKRPTSVFSMQTLITLRRYER